MPTSTPLSLDAFLQQFDQSTNAANDGVASDLLTSIGAYLTGGEITELRVYVADAPGYGTQASTVDVLRRLVAAGYAGNVLVAYDGDDTPAKLAVLLPGLNPKALPGPGGTGFALGGATLYFQTLASVGSPALQPLAVTGGSADTTTNLAGSLNTSYYLQLQPYGSDVLDACWKAGDTAGTPLAGVVASPGFAQSGYNLPKPSTADVDWTAFQGDAWFDPNMVAVAQQIATDLGGATYDFLPAYGFSDAPGYEASLAETPDSVLYTLVCAVAVAQQQAGSALGKPIVVGVMADLESSTWSSFAGYVQSPPSTPVPGMANALAFGALLKVPYASGVPQNVTILATRSGGSPTLKEYSDAVAQLGADDILVVPIPGAPKSAFDLLFSLATLPAVVGGGTLENLMLSLGRPYLKLTKPSESNVYPGPFPISVPLPKGSTFTPPKNYGHYSPGEATALTLVAASLEAPLASWPTLTTKATVATALAAASPANTLADFFNPRGQDADYFTLLAGFFGKDRNDKLVSALGYLLPSLPQKTPPTPPSLTDLYNALNTPPTVDVLQGLGKVSSGQILGFLTGWSSVLVQDATVAQTDSAVTVDGKTDSFGIAGLIASFVFTAPANSSAYQLVLTLSPPSTSLASFGFTAAPWFSLASPSLSVTVTSDGVPTAGTLTASVTIGSAVVQLSVALGDPPGQIVLSGALLSGAPTLAGLFAFLGGVNVVNALPAAISGVSLAGFQVNYVYPVGETPGKLAGFNVTFQTNADWNLFGPLTLKSGTTLTVGVDDPAGSASVTWSALAPFLVNNDPKQEIDFGLSYAPLTASANLADGSQVHLDDLLQSLLGSSASVPAATLTSFTSQLVFGTPLTYQLSFEIDESWSIPSSKPVFTLTDVAFQVQGTGPTYDSSGKIATPGTSSGSASATFDGPVAGSVFLVSAAYSTTDKWSFSIQESGTPLDLGALAQKYLGWTWGGGTIMLSDLGAAVWTSDDTWQIQGTASWIPSFIDSLSVATTITAKVGYGPHGEPSPSKFANVVLGVSLLGVGVTLTADFKSTGTSTETEYTFLFDDFPDAQATVKTGDDATVVTLALKGQTLGGLIEKFVGWYKGTAYGLSSPWNLLDDVDLSDLSIQYTFSKNETKKGVSLNVNVGPVDLGFARIDSIGITYDKVGGLQLTLQGSFAWNETSPSALSWDPSDPTAAPAPPGNGNKYFDLKLLAMGQHILADDLAKATTVQDAIAQFYDLPTPSRGEIGVEYDAGSSWLLGIDARVLKLSGGSDGGAGLARTDAPADGGDADWFITAQVVFNDPVLYGLRIALNGEPAKIFKGLDFQIMYRQVTPTVGVYQAQIVLPDAMRNLSIGAYSITLPVFGVAIYTNGDFLIDIGFPWNQDFSRSLTIQGIIYPGIPVLGSAGLYFGKLSSATSSQVPVTQAGTFNPVIVFGFGLQVGFGKSVQYGVLSGGFSVTVFGILEGVIAKFNPYALPQGRDSGASSQIQGSYYFWLQGTVGIIGKLYATLDFSVVKANVNIELKLMVQLTYESYVSISISVSASVDVSISVQINLGLFKITLHFSFHMTIKETFTLKNSGQAPWAVPGGSSPKSLLRASPHRRQRAFARALKAAPGGGSVWSNLLPPAGGAKLPLIAYFTTSLAMAGDEWAETTSAADQFPCYVAGLFIPCPDPSQTVQGTDTPFETTAKMVFRWVVASILGPYTAADLDNQIVSEVQLDALLETLTSTDANPTPLSPEMIDAFMASQFEMTLQPPPQVEGQDPLTACFFPMVPGLGLDVPAIGSYAGYSYAFDAYNSITAGGLQNLRGYFAQLLVQVEQEQGGGSKATVRMEAGPGLSLASWIYSDYFLLLARQMVQGARDALRDFQYRPAADDTPGGIVSWIDARADWGDGPLFDLHDLFVANPAHPLTPKAELWIGASLAVPADGSVTGWSDSTSFTGLAEHFAQNPVDLARANVDVPGLLVPGTSLTYGGQTYPAVANDTLATILATFAALLKGPVKLADFLSSATLTGGAKLMDAKTGVLQAGTTTVLPEATYQTSGGGSFTSVANPSLFGSGLTAQSLATQSAGLPILVAGTTITYGTTSYVVAPLDTLVDVAQALGVGLDKLLADPAVLGTASLIPPLATLFLPVFTYQTGANDSLQTVASRFGLTVGTLGDQGKNGGVVGLFDRGTDDSPLFLDVPHLPGFLVGEILKEIQRSLGLQHLSGMASRYYLHGLRLPTTDVTPVAAGMWVQNGALPPYAGLFALTGQQFLLPPTASLGSFSAWLTPPATESWLVFPGNAKTLPIPALTSNDVASATNVAAYAQANALDVGLLSLGTGKMSQSGPSRYPLPSPQVWQAATPPVLPYGVAPTGAPSYRLWTIPGAMLDLPNLPARPGVSLDGSRMVSTRRIAPTFQMGLARYDEATGKTADSPVTNYGWATIVRFTVKRVSAFQQAADTYEVVGASGDDLVILERMVMQTPGEDAWFESLYLGYAPSASAAASSGIQTDGSMGDGNLTFGIAQVNLSTVTTPPPAPERRSQRRMDAAEDSPVRLNTPTQFAQLLWEASITRAGGFYLYYYNAAGKTGLPERIFNGNGEANLSMVAVFAQNPFDNGLTNFMNAVATSASVDLTNTTVYAYAGLNGDPAPDTFVPPPATATAPPPYADPGLFANDSLNTIAYAYFSEVGDLAEANADLTLGPVTITVDQGTYLVPVQGGTGQSLADIATRFGTTAAAINAANDGSLAASLLYPTAIRLPEIAVTNSFSGPSAWSLNAISAFFGQNLISLASANADVQGIFGPGQSANPTVEIPAGPRARNPVVAAGIQAYTASRPPLTPVPDDPNSPGYALDFLQSAYTLLNLKVYGNGAFKESNLGLPAGPLTTPADPVSLSKVQRPQPMDASTPLDYAHAIPYAALAENQLQPSYVPPRLSAASPYSGLNQLLQVEFGWQDLYGNRLYTTLDQPPVPGKPSNYVPAITGYADALIGLGQWPSVSSGYQVVPGSTPGDGTFEVLLDFGSASYKGVLKADPVGKTTIQLDFTDPIDPQSGRVVGNYALSAATDGDPATVAISSVSVSGSTATLSLSQDLKAATYLLTVKNVIEQSTLGTEYPVAFDGTAGFAYSDDSQASDWTSTVQSNAQKDLNTYSTLFYQLTDPNGITLGVASTLFVGGPQTLPATDLQLLVGWLFGPSGSVYAYLLDRAEFGSSVPAPNLAPLLTLDLPASAVNPAEIFELSAGFVVSRTSAPAFGDLQTTPEIVSSTTPVAAYATQPSRGTTASLTPFAQSLEAALSVTTASAPGSSYLIKVASGVDREQATGARGGNTLWAVRLGFVPTNAGAVSFSIERGDGPTIFAPQPMSNTLVMNQSIIIPTYTTGSGLSGGTPTTFNSIDMDVWGRLFFGAVDEVLSPRFTGPAQILSHPDVPDENLLANLLKAKSDLAQTAQGLMVPVFEASGAAPPATVAAVQKSFYQQLLVRLSNVYAVKAGLVFDATVGANLSDANSPQLYGNVVGNPKSSLPRPVPLGVSLSSPKLVLTNGDQPLAVLLTAPDAPMDDTGKVVKELILDLAYQGTAIEHQIELVPGVNGYTMSGYEASSWLQFVVSPDLDTTPLNGLAYPLQALLGNFTVPLLLRSFPTAPTLLAQMGTPTKSNGNSLEGAKKWEYAFRYSLPFHYFQDTATCRVVFNESARSLRARLLPPKNAFEALAQFVSVWDAVQADLQEHLAPITAQTKSTDPGYTEALVALQTFVTLVQNVASLAPNGWAPSPTSALHARLGADNSVTFVIEETSDVSGNLLVSVTGDQEALDLQPWVDLPGATSVLFDGPPPGTRSFVYTDQSTGKPLSAKDGQAITDRIVTIKGPSVQGVQGLDILEYQDARASVQIQRNQDFQSNGASIQPEFVYQTPEVRFTNPCMPLIDVSEPLRIDQIPSPTSAVMTPKGDALPTYTRSLYDHLDALMVTLLDAGETSATVQLQATYSFELRTGAFKTILPVFMQRPLLFNVVAPPNPTLDGWAKAIATWYATAEPSTNEARINLDLVVMSDLTNTPMPLIRFRNLELPITSIDPPLT